MATRENRPQSHIIDANCRKFTIFMFNLPVYDNLGGDSRIYNVTVYMSHFILIVVEIQINVIRFSCFHSYSVAARLI